MELKKITLTLALPSQIRRKLFFRGYAKTGRVKKEKTKKFHEGKLIQLKDEILQENELIQQSTRKHSDLLQHFLQRGFT